MRVAALLVAGVLVVLALIAAAVYVSSELKLHATVAAPAESIGVPTDIAAIQHGQHVVGAIALCTQCHGATLEGAVIEDDRLARVVAPNLTHGAGLDATNLARAIRDGQDPSGRALWIMPSDDYHIMTDLDLSGVIAYLMSLPPVPTALPAGELRPAGRLLLSVGQLPLIPEIDRSATRPRDATPGETPEYGQYLVQIAGCARCHGATLSGGRMPGAPPNAVIAANLTPAALGDWSEADFLRAMRSGRRPDNRPLDASMPWPYFAQMTDLELGAIWRFLGAIQARPTGT